MVVCSQPVWPSDIGWRLRVANVVEQLGRNFTVDVVAPSTEDASPPSGVQFHPLPVQERDPKFRNLIRPAPHMGTAALGPRRLSVLARLVETRRPRSMLFTDSPLAAVFRPSLPTIVDFANIELHRCRAFARHDRWSERPSLAIEALKAARWEPRVCRAADVAVALSDHDAAWLRHHGGNVVVVPNALDAGTIPYAPSAEAGPVTYVASADYEPNRDAGWWLLKQVWPEVRRRSPSARLRIVGRAADQVFGRVHDDSVSVHADVADVAPFYNESSLVLAPVKYGAGSQLKVSEGLGHGRMLVATPYSARSVPPDADAQCLIADSAERFASAIAILYENADIRHRLERSMTTARSWEDVTAPLIEAVAGLRVRS